MRGLIQGIQSVSWGRDIIGQWDGRGLIVECFMGRGRGLTYTRDPEGSVSWVGPIPGSVMGSVSIFLTTSQKKTQTVELV